jgi:hypothetical protein
MQNRRLIHQTQYPNYIRTPLNIKKLYSFHVSKGKGVLIISPLPIEIKQKQVTKTRFLPNKAAEL